MASTPPGEAPTPRPPLPGPRRVEGSARPRDADGHGMTTLAATWLAGGGGIRGGRVSALSGCWSRWGTGGAAGWPGGPPPPSQLPAIGARLPVRVAAGAYAEVRAQARTPLRSRGLLVVQPLDPCGVAVVPGVVAEHARAPGHRVAAVARLGPRGTEFRPARPGGAGGCFGAHAGSLA